MTLFALGSLLLMVMALTPESYPPTRVDDVTEDFHGQVVADPYRWLEDGSNPEVQAWVEAQGAYTRATLDAHPGREALQAQYEALWQYPITTEAEIAGDRLFWKRRDAGADQPVVYSGTFAQGPTGGTVFLDLNTLSEDGTVAMDWMQPSRDGVLVAYGLSEGGSERSTLYVRNALTGEKLPDVIPFTRASSIAWLPDNSGFYYSRLPEPGTVPEGEESFWRRIYFHALGSDPAEDPLVFGDSFDKETWVSVGVSHDYSTIFGFASTDWARNDLYMRPLTGPVDAPWTPLVVGEDGRTSAEVVGEHLILLSNVGAPRFRILKGLLADPLVAEEIIPEGDGVIETFAVVDGLLAVQTLENAFHQLNIYDLNGALQRTIALPTLGTLSGLHAHPTEPLLICSFTSFTYAPAILQINARTGDVSVLSQLEIPLDWDRYAVAQEWATSKDGTQVPMFVVSLKDRPRDGSNPTILYGYGGFNNSLTPYFSRGALPWIEAGGIYVYANLRGGGEFGKEWHEAGRLERKQNVYDDFIACAEYLFAEEYTRPEKLAIAGGSNGGLLVGAVMVQRPDLCRAVICSVPLLDMLRYHRFLLGRLWIPEYGDPENPEHFPFLRAYSPYHNAVPGTDYPAVLFMSGDQDSRVDPLHARKMAALLQQDSASGLPVLLRVEFKAGHGQGSPLSKVIVELTDQYTFLATQLGVGTFPVASPLLVQDATE